MPEPTTIFIIAAVGTSVGVIGVYSYWWLVSRYKVATAEPRPLRARAELIWRDPGEVEALDFRAGPGGRDGAPVAPFRFVIEHDTGSNPCLSVHDARERTWRVKWGDEVKSETFAVRLVWAAGYFAEIAYYVPEGEIEGAKDLGRARTCVTEDCRFVDARFERDEAGVQKHFDEHGWSWDDNPFVGTKELNGLKILTMLLSNWDNKDVRDVARGSNTAVFEYRLEDGSIEARYLIIDWGATLGRWGVPGTRAKWDAAAYEAQTPDFVLGVENNTVRFGYMGQRTDEATEGITVEDVRWLYRYLGRVTDRQLRDGLLVSGATLEESDTFTRALRARLEQLRRVSELGDAYETAVSG